MVLGGQEWGGGQCSHPAPSRVQEAHNLSMAYLSILYPSSQDRRQTRSKDSHLLVALHAARDSGVSTAHLPHMTTNPKAATRPLSA